MDITRRIVLAGMRCAAVGTAAGISRSISAMASETPDLPWTYVKLDPEETRILGHELYYGSNCASGAFKAIITQLRDVVGFPYTQVPIDIYTFGGGGVTGWGTICGTLNGVGGAITLAAGKANNDALMNELVGWYTMQAFPTNESNACAEAGLFNVDKEVSRIALPQSVSESPLCHVSVGAWCSSAELASKSAERAERCARVTGDVAAKAVELLNALHDDTFTATFELPDDIKSCTACHKVGTVIEAGHNTLGKLNCLSCHDSHF